MTILLFTMQFASFFQMISIILIMLLTRLRPSYESKWGRERGPLEFLRMKRRFAEASYTILIVSTYAWDRRAKRCERIPGSLSLRKREEKEMIKYLVGKSLILHSYRACPTR